jgi:hypothetical protein
MDTVEPNGRRKKVNTVNSSGTVDTLEKVVEICSGHSEAQCTQRDTVGHNGAPKDTVGETVDTVDTVAH